MRQVLLSGVLTLMLAFSGGNKSVSGVVVYDGSVNAAGVQMVCAVPAGKTGFAIKCLRQPIGKRPFRMLESVTMTFNSKGVYLGASHK